MTDIVVPFDNNPESVAVKTNTSNEAVAAGKYAKCVVHCPDSGSSFFIDDAIALTGSSQTNATASTLELTGNDLNVNNAAGAGTTAAFTYASEGVAVTQEFWVPTGTNLKITSNARYVLTLYPVIT